MEVESYRHKVQRSKVIKSKDPSDSQIIGWVYICIISWIRHFPFIRFIDWSVQTICFWSHWWPGFLLFLPLCFIHAKMHCLTQQYKPLRGHRWSRFCPVYFIALPNRWEDNRLFSSAWSPPSFSGISPRLPSYNLKLDEDVGSKTLHCWMRRWDGWPSFLVPWLRISICSWMGSQMPSVTQSIIVL